MHQHDNVIIISYGLWTFVGSHWVFTQLKVVTRVGENGSKKYMSPTVSMSEKETLPPSLSLKKKERKLSDMESTPYDQLPPAKLPWDKRAFVSCPPLPNNENIPKKLI